MRAWTLILAALPIVSLLAGVNWAGEPAQNKTVRVLFLVGGMYHDYDEAPDLLARNLRQSVAPRLNLTVTTSHDLALLNTAELAKTDLLMFNVCQQTGLSADQRSAFVTAVRNGLPVVALHCTFWSFQDFPEFKKILGAFVPGHSKFGPMCLHLAAPDNPITAGVAKTFELTDEPYLVNERDPSMSVLVRTCDSYEGREGTEPEVWTKSYGKGRIFAMTFGHNLQSQQDPNYLKLLANGVSWALTPQ